MRDGWERVALREVCVLRRDRLDPRRMPADRVLKHFSIPAFDSTGGPSMDRAGHLRSHKFTVDRPSLLVSLLNPRIPRTVIAQGGPDVVCSTEMAVLQPRWGDVTIGYLGVWASSDAFRRELERLVAGTTGSRQRVDPPELLDLPFAFPPLAEQRRIVDLVGALDAGAALACTLARAAETALVSFLDEVASQSSGNVVRPADLLALSVGGDWGGDPGTGEIDLPVYRQTEFTDVGLLSRPAQAVRSLSVRKLERRRLRPGDILLQKSAGTPSLPGRVVRCPDSIEEAVPSNFLQLLRPDPAQCSPAFLFWHLWRTHRVGIALDYQAGTNIRNLDVGRYLLREFVLPHRSDQDRIAAAADELQGVMLRATDVEHAIAGLRAALLADLLSGSHAIPPSYDRFLDGAA